MKIEDVINKDTITSVIAVFGLIAVYYQVQQSNKCSLFEKRLNIYSFYKELYDSWISCEMWNDSLDLFIKNQNMPAQAIFLCKQIPFHYMIYVIISLWIKLIIPNKKNLGKELLNLETYPIQLSSYLKRK